MSRNPADMDLINGCMNNDRRAQELLYKQYHGPMTTIFLKYTRNEHNAVEVLHNGFLKVFKNIQQYDGTKASLYTWIRTIMINSAIDFIRQRDRRKQHIDIDMAAEPQIDSEVIQKLNADELLKLVRKLPPATQAVFNLYVIEGFNHKEIGSIMGISEGTSKWHLSESRRLLQKLLQTLYVVR